jgi:hypothetical protein
MRLIDLITTFIPAAEATISALAIASCMACTMRVLLAAENKLEPGH